MAQARFVVLVADHLRGGIRACFLPAPGEAPLEVEHRAHDVGLPLGVLRMGERTVRQKLVRAENRLIVHASEDMTRRRGLGWLATAVICATFCAACGGDDGPTQSDAAMIKTM